MKNIVCINLSKFAFVFLITLLLNSCKDKVIQPTTAGCMDNSVIYNPNHPKAQAIQAKIDEFVNQGVPGVSVLISDGNGNWAGSAGYADIAKGIKMEPCYVNKLGSITKMMIGALSWTLIQEGKLAIDAPISNYIPDIAKKITNGNQITFGMLINHSSGIFDIAGSLGYNLAVINDFSRSWSADEIVKFVENKPATNAPGQDVHYSNTNTMLESMILEKVTGRKTADLLQERIFTPLQMDNTVYYDYSKPFPFTHLAQGYLDFNNDGGSIQNISELNPGSGNGYTGVYSTVADLYKFMNALLRDKILISPENLDYIFATMKTPSVPTWRSSFGAIHQEFMGTLPANIHAYGHTGGDIGYSANLAFIPENNTIFAATYNYGTNLGTDLGQKVNQLRQDLITIMAE